MKRYNYKKVLLRLSVYLITGIFMFHIQGCKGDKKGLEYTAETMTSGTIHISVDESLKSSEVYIIFKDVRDLARRS